MKSQSFIQVDIFIHRYLFVKQVIRKKARSKSQATGHARSQGSTKTHKESREVQQTLAGLSLSVTRQPASSYTEETE